MTIAPFPRGVRVAASSVGHGSALGALFSAAWRKHAEHSHAEFWSATDATATHRVTVDWTDSVRVRAVRIRFGHAPKTLRAFARRGDRLDALAVVPALETEISVGGDPIDGIAIEQPPGGPSAMRIACLAVVSESVPDVAVGLVRGSEVEWPAMPLATDGDPATYLDASDSDALQIVCASPRPIDRVVLDLVGDVVALAAFWPAIEARDPWSGRVAIDVAPGTTDRLRIDLPTPPSILGITSVSVESK